MRRLPRVPSVVLALVAFGVAACSLRRGQEKEAPPARVTSAPIPTPTVKLARSTSALRESGGIGVATAADGETFALLVDADDRAVVVLDAKTLDVVARTELEGTPEDVIVLPGGEIAVTLRDKNLVVVLSPRGNAPADGLVATRRARTAEEPRSLAVTPDDRTLLVTAGAAHRVQAFDVGTFAPRWSKDVPREPRAIAVSADGKTALVTHAARSEITVLPLEDPSLALPRPSTVDLALPAAIPSCSYGDPARIARNARTLVRRPPQAEKEHETFFVPVVQSAPRGASTHGYGAAPMGEPEALVDVPRTTPDWGLSAFDLRAVDLDAARSGVGRYDAFHWFLRECLLPRAAIATERGVLVACEGESTVVEVERDLQGWSHVVSRFEVGRGPTAIARLPDGERAVVWSRFARTASLIAVKNLGSKGASLLAKPSSRPVELTKVVARTRPFDEQLAHGAELFHRTGDARIARSGVACATCHPDGRDDDIVWMAPGGRSRTLLLAGNIADRDRYGWSGEHTTIAARIAATIERLEGKGLEAAEVEALAVYLRALPPPGRLDGTTPEVARGAAIFRSSHAGCTSCHTVERSFTDRQAHDVGSGGVFLTPSLVGVGARRALFHDGRYPDVGALLAGAKDMGGSAALDDEERAALGAYLRTL
jgi:mono/diheme cytochrome c family protein